VKTGTSRLYKGIDLPETLSNLTGKRIRRVKPNSPRTALASPPEPTSGRPQRAQDSKIQEAGRSIP